MKLVLNDAKSWLFEEKQLYNKQPLFVKKTLVCPDHKLQKLIKVKLMQKFNEGYHYHKYHQLAYNTNKYKKVITMSLQCL